nr:(d)CMP kinase [Fastidiosibacter lacustris]
MGNKVDIITVDGPSGVGKGTLSRLLAKQFDYALLDSGAIYRLAALLVLDQQLDLCNEERLYHTLKNLNIDFKIEDDKTTAYLNGVDVSHRIREEKTGMIASKIAKIPIVREALLACQKDFAKGVKGLVADGRDMGTVVFPNAQYKFFLDAEIQVRAKRRYDELVAKAEKADYNEILEQLQARDAQDRNRAIAPLKAADDAIVVDTSNLDINGVFNKVLTDIKRIDRLSYIKRWQKTYYGLLVKNIDTLSYVPEFLDKPYLVNKANTRLLCQTRGMFYLITYARLNNLEDGWNKAFKLYQQIKALYWNHSTQSWHKFVQDGNVSDPYEYAFLLFSLSHLYQKYTQTDLLADILKVNQLIQEKFVSEAFKNLKDAQGVIGQNALMHLFESYLSAYRYTKSDIFKNQAQALYEQIIILFFDHKQMLMREYSIEYQPVVFEPGHSFEWSALILEALELGVDVGLMPDHKALFLSASQKGVNANGLVRSNLNNKDDQTQYRIWPMLEYMRYLAMTKQENTLEAAFEIFAKVFIANDLPIEYIDHNEQAAFDKVKSTTGYHLINCWQYISTKRSI